MNFQRSHRFIKLFSTLTPTTRTTQSSSNWRTQIKQSQLVSQISSILLQRHNWAPILQTLNLSSKITPTLFLQILRRTQHHPQISLTFFNWVKTHLGFKPDLKSQCQIIQISLEGSDFPRSVEPILDSLIQSHPALIVADSMIQACQGEDFECGALSSFIKCYSKKGLFMEGLEVFRKMRSHGFSPSISACNELLDALQRGNEVKLAWCFLGAMIRVVDPDPVSWSLVAQILCKNGQFEKVVRFLEKGIYNSEIYDLLVDFYSKTGDFEAAFNRLNEMNIRKLDTSFCTYSSILDGACKYNDGEVIKRIIRMMIEKQLLPRYQFSENDLIIQKLCDLRKTYAAEMLFKKAYSKNIRLQDDSYGSLLKALSEVGRIYEATKMYRTMLKRGIKVKDSCYCAFVNVLCNEDRSDDGYGLLVNIMKQGHDPCPSQLSKYITSQCRRKNWSKTEELLDLILEKGLLPDSLGCCLLMEYYCFNRLMDRVVALHDKMEKVKGCLDVTTYNMILDGLWRERKAEEAVKVFDYMMGLNLVNCASFTIMICELCHTKELRKAMKIHDEMLDMGLKPDKGTYKRLISGFK